MFRFADGKRGRVVLQIAGFEDLSRAKLAKPRGGGAILRHDEAEPREKTGDEGRSMAPVMRGTGRDARIDERERDVLAAGGEDEVRPELGFDPDREIGPPVIEEARAVVWMVERYILVEGAGWQAIRHELCRGDGACRHEDMEPGNRGEKTRNERQDGEGFADARAVKPDKRSFRPVLRRNAQALAKARGVFLSAGLASAQEERHKRGDRARHRPVAEKPEGWRFSRHAKKGPLNARPLPCPEDAARGRRFPPLRERPRSSRSRR